MMERRRPVSSFTLLAASGSNAAIITFAIYIFGVMVLAWLSNRLLQSKSFLSEYFLGSRSLGVWAFALTFAATSSSGGSFIGFPSLVYMHGWIVALWIGCYMIVPIVSMGLLAKRINQVGRKSGAITIPDILRDRFESPLFGTVATGLIVFFMVFNLIAQFKSGSVILESLLQDVPLFETASHALADMLRGVPILGASEDKPGYLLCLFVFAAAVVLYTAYGGFRAVVWTDVMQGFVMVGGVIVMLPLAIWAVGGLGNATREMAQMTPPNNVKLELTVAESMGQTFDIPSNSWLVSGEGDERRVFRTAARAQIPPNEMTAAYRDDQGEYNQQIPGIELTYEKQATSQEADVFEHAVSVRVVESKEYKSGAGQVGTYVTGPGPHPTSNAGFLPFSLAVSFFFMWTFSGAGQPSNMVRLMAFNSATTLRRAIFTVSIYYSLIYFPLVIIFCCARVLLPGWETDSDRIMPEMAKLTTELVNMPWLAGLLVAAPFAAVMSTMDSFLLMISSAVVRDIYQRHINPEASDKTIKRMTYGTTISVGAIAMLAAVSPPQFLQDIIVFTGSGLSTSFLAPVALMLYWPRFNHQGAIAGMLGGFATLVTLYTIGTIQSGRVDAYKVFGFHPFMVGLITSFTLAIVVALLTSPPPDHLVRKYFYKDAE
jgi:sodium/pantothenate symporter